MGAVAATELADRDFIQKALWRKLQLGADMPSVPGGETLPH